MGFLHGVWAHFMDLITNVSTTQLVLAVLAGIAGIWILKVIFSRGGARKRMKGMAAVWIMIPFVVGIGGVIIYFVIKALATAPGAVT